MEGEKSKHNHTQDEGSNYSRIRCIRNNICLDSRYGRGGFQSHIHLVSARSRESNAPPPAGISEHAMQRAGWKQMSLLGVPACEAGRAYSLVSSGQVRDCRGIFTVQTLVSCRETHTHTASCPHLRSQSLYLCSYLIKNRSLIQYLAEIGSYEIKPA